MTISRRQCLALFVAGLTQSPTSSRALDQQWRKIAGPTDGITGVAAIHLTTGMSFRLNAGDSFPLASVCKLPIAMNIFAMVDERKLHLDDVIDIPRQDVWSNVSVIAERWPSVQRFKLDEVLSL